MTVLSWLRTFARDTRGAALIETAVLAPTLIVMCVGGFEVSAMVARQSELQSSAELATEIALATSPESDAELETIEDILEDSSNLADAQVTLMYKYRCGIAATLTTSLPVCTEDALSTYIAIEMTDQYEPVWTQWGIGEELVYQVNRTVQIS